MFVGRRPLSWDKLLLSSTIKEILTRNRLGRAKSPPPAPQLKLAAQLHVRSLWTLPQPLPAALSSISTTQPFHPLIRVPEPWREGEGGHRVKVFSSLDLGACWEKLGKRMAALEQRLGGQDFNFVKEQLVWVSPHISFPSLSPHIQGDEKFVQRGTSKIKKVYSPKPLPSPCSSIREECNNISIWPQLDWLKTRKCFLYFSDLTDWRNIIKKFRMYFFILETRGIHFLKYHFPWKIIHITLNRWDWPFWQLCNQLKTQFKSSPNTFPNFL